MHLTAIDPSFSLRKERTSKLFGALASRERSHRPISRTTKIAMKLSVFFILIVCLQVSARTNGQTVTLDLKKAPIEKVFNEVSKQTGYSFLYNEALLKDVAPVTIRVKDASITEVLNRCFSGQPVRFSIEGNAIMIKKNPEVPSTLPGNTIPPPIEITGHVTNEQGQSLSGAYVINKKTGKGTTTDAKGFFRLSGLNTGDVFTVSYIGYKDQNIKIGTITDFTLVMQEATNELDKVQIQAYGTTNQRFATGNIATVTAAEIERQPVMNPLEALQSKVPGVVVQQTNGYASAPFKVEIRGRSVINPNLPSEPLYIIDGVPLAVLNLGQGGNYLSGSLGITQNGFTGPAGGQSPLFSVNPDDIESITVLKDADATAIYGSRGANGVVIITTKRGKAGRTKFDMSVYQGISKVTNHYDLLNTQQYLSVRREAFKNNNIAMNAGNAYDILLWDTTRYTDWQKVMWGGTGKTTNLDLSLSGGDKQTNFRIGGSYHRQTTILTKSGSDQRASVQFNLTHKSLNQRLVSSFTSSYSYSISDLINMNGAVTLPPDAPAIFDANGNLNYAGWGPPNSSASSRFVFSNLLQPYTAKTGFLNSQLKWQYEFIKGLTLSSSLGYSTYHNSQIQLTPIASQDPANAPLGSSQFGNNDGVNSIVEPQLEYKGFFGRGSFDAMVGGSLESASGDASTIYASGYVNDHLLRSASNAPTTQGFNGAGEYKYVAAFSRVNYNWDKKYIVNFSARRDGSSKFGSGKQYGNFGAIGAAWIFTEESWFKRKLAFLSFGKLRGSYGTTGSDEIPSYQYLTQWSAAGVIPYQQNGSAGYVPLLHANPNLQWQVNKKAEVALDMGFIKDRITMEIAWYENRCGNQLLPFILPAITGFGSVTANFPALVQNQGWEALVKSSIIDQKNLTWSINFNIGLNQNKLLNYPNLSQSPYAAAFTIGQPLGIVRKLHYIGVDPQTGTYAFFDKNHNSAIDNGYNNGDNDLYNEDLSVKFEGGIGSDFRYQGWELNLFFSFRKQLRQSAIYSSGNPGQITNQSTDILNHWQKTGDVAPYARYTTGGANSDYLFWAYSDAVYSDGSYVRLRNLSVSHQFPEDFIRRAKISNLQLFVRGENLILITKYKGVDPDTPGLGLLPPSKTITGGLQFNF